jgi:aminopeptidase N
MIGELEKQACQKVAFTMSTIQPVPSGIASLARPSAPPASTLVTPAAVDSVSIGRCGDPAPPDPPPTPTPGADGIGDPYFPQMGNGGYDAQHYTVDMSVDVDANTVQATTTMDARATQDLSSLNLDLRGFEVSKVTVNGGDAKFSRKDGELTVVPAEALKAGDDFQVAVQYSGEPEPWQSQGVSFEVGWKKYDGGISVDCEPDGASSWIPVNDHPRDKASYTFKIDVPSGYQVAANGTLVATEDHDGRTRFTWDAKDPMASYLAMIQIGDYQRQDDSGPNGLPIRNYFPPRLADAAKYDFGRTGEMIDYFGQLFGPYPHEAYGAVVIPRSEVGGALECQTMSIFDPFVVTGDRSYENVVAHELTHQWFGDGVSVKNWKDIWLNEGFASYGEWLWQEKTQGADSVRQTAREVYDWLAGRGRASAVEPPSSVRKMLAAHRHGLDQHTWGPIQIGAPPSNDLFDEQVYMKGALVLYALREKVGDSAFFDGMRSYFGQYKGGNAEIADFQAVMEKTSGQPLGDFFQSWLYQTDMPPFPAPPQPPGK